MRKRLYIIFTVVFFLLVLAGCNSAESPSAPVPESSTAPSEQPEITQDELYRQFEQVYDDFGASVVQDQEQLAVELEALEKMLSILRQSGPQIIRRCMKAGGQIP